MSTDFINFYSNYKSPEIEKLVVGYSGIDPPLKTDGTGLNHEDLDGLLGGNDEGHYHLTKTQIEQLSDMYEVAYKPKIIPNQTINITAEEETNPYEVLGKNIKIGEE